MKALKVLFGIILIGMLGVTVWASLHENVAAGLVKIWAEPWALATLVDAYAGFLTFYAWVFYKETSIGARFFWLAAILFLGNIAMSFYVLWQLRRLPAGDGAEALLLRRAPSGVDPARGMGRAPA